MDKDISVATVAQRGGGNGVTQEQRFVYYWNYFENNIRIYLYNRKEGSNGQSMKDRRHIENK